MPADQFEVALEDFEAAPNFALRSYQLSPAKTVAPTPTASTATGTTGRGRNRRKRGLSLFDQVGQPGDLVFQPGMAPSEGAVAVGYSVSVSVGIGAIRTPAGMAICGSGAPLDSPLNLTPAMLSALRSVARFRLSENMPSKAIAHPLAGFGCTFTVQRGQRNAASTTWATRRRILSRSMTQTFLPWYRSVNASKSTCELLESNALSNASANCGALGNSSVQIERIGIGDERFGDNAVFG